MTAVLWMWLALVGCGTSAPPAAVAPAPAEVASEQHAAAEPEAAPAEEPGTADASRRVFFLEPEDGAAVASPVKVRFGIEGMAVKPAGQLVDGTGHHHLIIGPAGIAKGQTVPKDEKHIHFGKGQTEADVELEPGEYQLTMQFADGNHVSYGTEMAATIRVTVQ